MNQDSSTEDLLQIIGKLWSESFHSLLSTQSLKYAGYPFGSLVPLCRDSLGNPLMMISHLAQHTRNLDADPHCALTMIQPNHTDVLQWTRLTCLAVAQPTTSNNALERYCRYYPDGRRYHKELNFSLYRLLPQQFYLIAGFGLARWFDVGRILEAPRFSTAAELEILCQLNSRDHDLLNRFLAHRGIPFTVTPNAVGADPSGLDIRLGDSLTRIHFQSPLDDEQTFISQLESTLSG
ncbi:MAG: pyridoxamine 5'-phosphate oxidase family protein [Candidatus Thiodiazotropha sp.]